MGVSKSDNHIAAKKVLPMLERAPENRKEILVISVRSNHVPILAREENYLDGHSGAR